MRRWYDSAVEPEVAVVGGGAAGLAVAAMLRAEGVRPVVLEAEPEIGAPWRERYDGSTSTRRAGSRTFPASRFRATERSGCRDGRIRTGDLLLPKQAL
jgi:cation diffusion facilitator CzcD-associated flavoprotein CzcO